MCRWPSCSFYPSGIVDLAAGLGLAVGYQARIAALLLALFTVVVTPIFHALWAVPAEQWLPQMLYFTKNAAILEGFYRSWRTVPGGLR